MGEIEGLLILLGLSIQCAIVFAAWQLGYTKGLSVRGGTETRIDLDEIPKSDFKQVRKKKRNSIRKKKRKIERRL